MIKRVFVFLILFLFLVHPFCAFCDVVKEDIKEPLVHKTDIALKSFEKLFKKVKIKTLQNGLTVIMYKRGYAPIFTGVLSVRVGGSDETVGKTGISHVFEHMAFKGTKTIGTKNYHKEKKLLAELETLSLETDGANIFTDEQKIKWDKIHSELKKLWNDEAFSKEYEKRGATSFNASTDKDITRYYVSLPKKEFEFWAKLEVDRILNPVMRQFYEEREVILEERKMRFENSPQGRMYENFLQTLFLTHPYRNPVIGYEDDIKHLTATDVANFQKKYYVPSNMVVAVVGDVDFDKDFKIIEKYFSKIPKGNEIKRNVLKEAKQQGERRVKFNYKANSSILIAYHKPNYPHKDDLTISLLSKILAGSKISALYTKLVKETKCASYVGVDEGPGDAYPNYIGFYIVPNGNCTNDKIINIYDETLGKFKENGFKEQDLKIAKKNMKTSLVAVLNSNESLATMLADTRLLYGSHEMILNWMQGLDGVTIKDLEKIIKKYFDVDNRSIGMIGE